MRLKRGHFHRLASICLPNVEGPEIFGDVAHQWFPLLDTDTSNRQCCVLALEKVVRLTTIYIQTGSGNEICLLRCQEGNGGSDWFWPTELAHW